MEGGLTGLVITGAGAGCGCGCGCGFGFTRVENLDLLLSVDSEAGLLWESGLSDERELSLLFLRSVLRNFRGNFDVKGDLRITKKALWSKTRSIWCYHESLYQIT